jgi:hypothetical protein
MLLILDSFVDRIQRDSRPLLLSVYAELGTIIAELCNAIGDSRLPNEARMRAALVLETELRSPRSHFQTYDQFRNFVHGITGKGLLNSEGLNALSRALTRAALLDLPAEDINLSDEYEEEFNRGEDLHILLDRILCSRGNEVATAPRLPDTDQCSPHAGAGRP